MPKDKPANRLQRGKKEYEKRIDVESMTAKGDTEARLRACRGMGRGGQLTLGGEIRDLDPAGGLVKRWYGKHQLGYLFIQG